VKFQRRVREELSEGIPQIVRHFFVNLKKDMTICKNRIPTRYSKASILKAYEGGHKDH